MRHALKGYLRLWAPQAGNVGEMLCRVEDIGDAVQDGAIPGGGGGGSAE